MLNYIWLALVLLAVAIGGWNDRWKEVTDGAFDGAKTAVTIALGLIGVMALWLGVMRLAERAGLVQKIARALRPIMRRLFPDVPAEHPAMGAMLMNMAANMLGLGNAATPLGLRAMRDLESLNPHPGTATNAMCTFLAINTASVQLIPTTAIAILVAAGSTRPTAIVGTALLATLCAATTAIIAVKTLEKLPWFARPVAAVVGRGSGENAAATKDLNSKSDRRKSFEQRRNRGRRPRLQCAANIIGTHRHRRSPHFFRIHFRTNGLATGLRQSDHRQRECFCPRRERAFSAGDSFPA